MSDMSVYIYTCDVARASPHDFQCFARRLRRSNANLWALQHACNVAQLQLLGPVGTWQGGQAGQEGLPSDVAG